jgi:hypothetical protein
MLPERGQNSKAKDCTHRDREQCPGLSDCIRGTSISHLASSANCPRAVLISKGREFDAKLPNHFADRENFMPSAFSAPANLDRLAAVVVLECHIITTVLVVIHKVHSPIPPYSRILGSFRK